MENNSVKKLSRAAVILSLTAVLASMPVSAAFGYANAGSWGAEATAIGPMPYAKVELSCELGPRNKSDSNDSIDDSAIASVSACVDDPEHHKGAVRAAYAAAWCHDEFIDEAYYPG